MSLVMSWRRSPAAADPGPGAGTRDDRRRRPGGRCGRRAKSTAGRRLPPPVYASRQPSAGRPSVTG